MRDVVILVMKKIQQVPAKVKELQSFSDQFPASIWSRLNSSVNVDSLSVLCRLHEWLDDAVDPTNARLPDCGPDRRPTATDPLATLANSLVDVVRSLEESRCIALAHARP